MTLRVRPWTLILPAVAGLAGHPIAAQTLPGVTITASPLNPAEPSTIQPASVLRGEALDRQRDTSLGSTLSQQPGVQESGFGISAGRPIIRGLDGPRVKITQGGLDAADASSLSPDHAVAADPLSAARIEVLRGPATLLYGGGAIGGLVNVVSDRIPTTRLGPVRGQALTSVDTGTSGHVSALGLRGGANGWNWAVDGFDRGAGNYRFPGAAVAGDPDSAHGRLPNSGARGRGFGTGLSYVGARGVLGVAYSELTSQYGIPSEEDVFIRLRQQRIEALGELEQPLPGVALVRFRAGDTRYRHDEVEGGSGEVGTAFRNRGREQRVELVHEPLLGVRGALGLQSNTRTLAASGEEAYVPSTREGSQALFYVGERAFGPARIELGWRSERVRLDPSAGADAPARRFGLNALSLGSSLALGSGYALSAGVTSGQRAPAIEELYANGLHAATATFENGNPELRPERSINVDFALRKTTGALQGRLGVYANRFANYIHGDLTDINGDGVADRVDEEGAVVNSPDAPSAGDLKRIAYAQGPARFRGVEFELAWRPAGSAFGLRTFGDLARGRLVGEGNAPRMSPSRIGAALDWRQGAWSGFVSALVARRQGRVAALETATGGYTRIDGEIAYTLPGGAGSTTTLFLQGRNLLNEQIRLHTSFIKDLVPQPGRTLIAGVRARF